ncbi:MAG: HD domain-containing protein [Candidatus Omnitrophica bacterium]|nr:HD domain-containing protein [Candidatus Omnitrophota bacterium]
MNQQSILNKTVEHVKKTLSGEGSGHDWWHIYRVWQNAREIGVREKADMFVVELAALLHDIADWKFHGGDDSKGPKAAREWMISCGVDEITIQHVCEIISEISFKGAGVASKINTKEGMVVQDADRLDAIGAIGIARTFAYGGHKGREMYNPEIKPEQHDTFDQYKKNSGPTVNHFYEKLLLLKDRMNTRSARELAESRHRFMEEFLVRFYAEWEGRQ